jgi:hypothetical protein
MTTNQDHPEITPEELVRLREAATKESLKYWASMSAKDLRRSIDKSLFDHR